MRLRGLRLAGVLAVTLSLAGCGGGAPGGVSGSQTGVLPALTTRLMPDPPGINQAEAQRLITGGAPRIAVYMIDRGGSVLMVKAGSRAGVDRWRSADNVQFHLRDGLIIGTRGLGFDLMTADTGGAAALILSGRPGQIRRVHRHLDGEGRMVIRSYVCDITPEQTETVAIPDAAPVQALRVTEMCHSPGGGFRNAHWVRGSQLVQTRQYISQGAGRVQIIFLP